MIEGPRFAPLARANRRFTARVLEGLARIDASAPLIVAHSGVFRALCHTLKIGEQEMPVSNALPLLFEQQAHGWRMSPVC